MKKYILEIVVLVTGAMIMILELVGSRVLAPTLGTGMFIWTSLIGVILASLAIGYWYGGKMADRKPDSKILFSLLLISAILIGTVGILHEQILKVIHSLASDIRTISFISALVLFGLPSIFLAMVSPYAVKLKLINLKDSGKTVGNLYALSTLGSIIGTFAAGFWLIPYFGSTKILLGLSVTAIVLAITVMPKINLKNNLLILIAFSLLFSYFAITKTQKNNLIETHYSTIKITQAQDEQTLRMARYLTVGPLGAQSAVFIDGGNDDLVSTYTKFYRMADFFNPKINKALMIGGGAFTYPRDFLKKHPKSTIDVVEIDPAMTNIAKKYFNFQNNANLKIINEDGRVFLNQNQNKYDAIFIDAFNCLTPPYNLTTVEAAQKMKQNLNPNGIVIANLVSAMSGANSSFTHAEYQTFKQEFSQVYLFLPSDLIPNPQKVQNIMLVATNSDQQLSFTSNNINENIFLQSLWQEKIPDAPVLTDDFAPVEYYLRNIENII